MKAQNKKEHDPQVELNVSKIQRSQEFLLMMILKAESQMMGIKRIYIQKEWAKKRKRILTRKAASSAFRRQRMEMRQL